MADSKSIKVSSSSYEILKEIAKIENESMQAIIDRLLREYRTKKFFEEVRLSYKNMSEEDWKEEMRERKLFENTLTDGLEDEENETW